MKTCITSLVLALALASTPVSAAAPQTLSYQGVLTDNIGAIVADGNYSITFRIYDDPALSGPHLMYTEAHDGVTAPLVPVSHGAFSVVLGHAVALTVLFNGPMWMELQLGADPPFAPRTEMTSAPYALNARNIFDGGASNFVGVGRATQVNSSEYFGIQAPAGAGIYGGMYIKTASATALPYYGYSLNAAYNAWTYLDGSDGNKWKVNNLGDRLTVTNTGRVGIGTTSPTTTLDVAGAAKLGVGAPAIKMLKFTGTTNGSQGGSVGTATGIATSKIIGVDVMVEYFPDALVPQAYTINPGYEFHYYIETTGTIYVWNSSANSSNILSKPYRILLTYEE